MSNALMMRTVANRDAAFLWETEALRAIPSRPDTRSDGPNPHTDDWLTLREASETTGVPVGTLRKWARHDNIPSFLEESSEGRLRMVSLEGIRQRADELGREIESPPQPEPVDEIDLTSGEYSEPEPLEPGVPEGTMLVPLDAWNKMLNQLGNLHEAGQQLAEARERAAKAETEATFLKERLSELRSELEKTRAGIDEVREPNEAPEQPAVTDAADLSVGGYTRALARQFYERWLGRGRHS